MVGDWLSPSLPDTHCRTSGDVRVVVCVAACGGARSADRCLHAGPPRGHPEASLPEQDAGPAGLVRLLRGPSRHSRPFHALRWDPTHAEVERSQVSRQLACASGDCFTYGCKICVCCRDAVCRRAKVLTHLLCLSNIHVYCIIAQDLPLLVYSIAGMQSA